MVLLHLQHPLWLVAVHHGLAIVTAGYTRAHSPVRLLSFVVSFFIAIYGLGGLERDLPAPTAYTRGFCGAVFCTPVAMFDKLILRRWSYEKDYIHPLDLPPNEKKKITRLAWANEAFAPGRGAGTSWECKNVPHFDEQNPDYVPPRNSYAVQCLLKLVGCYYLVDIIIQRLYGKPRQWAISNAPIVSRLSEITFAELEDRVESVALFWAMTYCYIQFFYYSGAFLAAIMQPISIKYWRPLFGPPSCSYTLRNFWGRFWHQLLRVIFTKPAEFITHIILRIPRGTIAARYTNIFAVFLLSGILHLYNDQGSGVPVADSGAIRFFCSNALGIMFEDGIQALFKKIWPSMSLSLKKLVGYAWVSIFLIWTTPAWSYPYLRVANVESLTLSPVGIQSMLKGAMTF